jgi:vacuolar-type H+-ATPase subunit I/STV1
MTVLSIIAIIVALILVGLFVEHSNNYSMKVYGYEIFNAVNFTLSVLGYFAIYFGYNWYMDALKDHGDLLNGVLLMGIGTLLLLGTVYMNIKRTSLRYGLIMSIVTEILYAVATPIVFFALLLAVAFFSQTKPVYNIND